MKKNIFKTPNYKQPNSKKPTKQKNKKAPKQKSKRKRKYRVINDIFKKQTEIQYEVEQNQNVINIAINAEPLTRNIFADNTTDLLKGTYMYLNHIAPIKPVIDEILEKKPSVPYLLFVKRLNCNAFFFKKKLINITKNDTYGDYVYTFHSDKYDHSVLYNSIPSYVNKSDFATYQKKTFLKLAANVLRCMYNTYFLNLRTHIHKEFLDEMLEISAFKEIVKCIWSQSYTVNTELLYRTVKMYWSDLKDVQNVTMNVTTLVNNLRTVLNGTDELLPLNVFYLKIKDYKLRDFIKKTQLKKQYKQYYDNMTRTEECFKVIPNLCKKIYNIQSTDEVTALSAPELHSLIAIKTLIYPMATLTEQTVSDLDKQLATAAKTIPLQCSLNYGNSPIHYLNDLLTSVCIKPTLGEYGSDIKPYVYAAYLMYPVYESALYTCKGCIVNHEMKLLHDTIKLPNTERLTLLSKLLPEKLRQVVSERNNSIAINILVYNMAKTGLSNLILPSITTYEKAVERLVKSEKYAPYKYIALRTEKQSFKSVINIAGISYKAHRAVAMVNTVKTRYKRLRVLDRFLCTYSKGTSFVCLSNTNMIVLYKIENTRKKTYDFNVTLTGTKEVTEQNSYSLIDKFRQDEKNKYDVLLKVHENLKKSSTKSIDELNRKLILEMSLKDKLKLENNTLTALHRDTKIELSKKNLRYEKMLNEKKLHEDEILTMNRKLNACVDNNKKLNLEKKEMINELDKHKQVIVQKDNTIKKLKKHLDDLQQIVTAQPQAQEIKDVISVDYEIKAKKITDELTNVTMHNKNLLEKNIKLERQTKHFQNENRAQAEIIVNLKNEKKTLSINLKAEKQHTKSLIIAIEEHKKLCTQKKDSMTIVSLKQEVSDLQDKLYTEKSKNKVSEKEVENLITEIKRYEKELKNLDKNYQNEMQKKAESENKQKQALNSYNPDMYVTVKNPIVSKKMYSTSTERKYKEISNTEEVDDDNIVVEIEQRVKEVEKKNKNFFNTLINSKNKNKTKNGNKNEEVTKKKTKTKTESDKIYSTASGTTKYEQDLGLTTKQLQQSKNTQPIVNNKKPKQKTSQKVKKTYGVTQRQYRIITNKTKEHANQKPLGYNKNTTERVDRFDQKKPSREVLSRVDLEGKMFDRQHKLEARIYNNRQNFDDTPIGIMGDYDVDIAMSMDGKIMKDFPNSGCVVAALLNMYINMVPHSSVLTKLMNQNFKTTINELTEFAVLYSLETNDTLSTAWWTHYYKTNKILHKYLLLKEPENFGGILSPDFSNKTKYVIVLRKTYDGNNGSLYRHNKTLYKKVMSTGYCDKGVHVYNYYHKKNLYIDSKQDTRKEILKNNAVIVASLYKIVPQYTHSIWNRLYIWLCTKVNHLYGYSPIEYKCVAFSNISIVTKLVDAEVKMKGEGEVPNYYAEKINVKLPIPLWAIIWEAILLHIVQNIAYYVLRGVQYVVKKTDEDPEVLKFLTSDYFYYCMVVLNLTYTIMGLVFYLEYYFNGFNRVSKLISRCYHKIKSNTVKNITNVNINIPTSPLIYRKKKRKIYDLLGNKKSIISKLFKNSPYRLVENEDKISTMFREHELEIYNKNTDKVIQYYRKRHKSDEKTEAYYKNEKLNLHVDVLVAYLNVLNGNIDNLFADAYKEKIENVSIILPYNAELMHNGNTVIPGANCTATTTDHEIIFENTEATYTVPKRAYMNIINMKSIKYKNNCYYTRTYHRSKNGYITITFTRGNQLPCTTTITDQTDNRGYKVLCENLKRYFFLRVLTGEYIYVPHDIYIYTMSMIESNKRNKVSINAGNIVNLFETWCDRHSAENVDDWLLKIDTDKICETLLKIKSLYEILENQSRIVKYYYNMIEFIFDIIRSEHRNYYAIMKSYFVKRVITSYCIDNRCIHSNYIINVMRNTMPYYNLPLNRPPKYVKNRNTNHLIPTESQIEYFINMTTVAPSFMAPNRRLITANSHIKTKRKMLTKTISINHNSIIEAVYMNPDTVLSNCNYNAVKASNYLKEDNIILTTKNFTSAKSYRPNSIVVNYNTDGKYERVIYTNKVCAEEHLSSKILLKNTNYFLFEHIEKNYINDPGNEGCFYKILFGNDYDQYKTLPTNNNHILDVATRAALNNTALLREGVLHEAQNIQRLVLVSEGHAYELNPYGLLNWANYTLLCTTSLDQWTFPVNGKIPTKYKRNFKMNFNKREKTPKTYVPMHIKDIIDKAQRKIATEINEAIKEWINHELLILSIFCSEYEKYTQEEYISILLAKKQYFVMINGEKLNDIVMPRYVYTQNKIIDTQKIDHKYLKRGLVIGSEATNFCRSCMILQAYIRDNTKTHKQNIKLINGVPGCGKSTYIAKNATKPNDIIVVAGRNNKYDLERLTNTLVYTADSIVINSTYFERCDRIFVDECVKLHAGQILYISKNLRAKEIIALGDYKQITYMSRIALVKYKHANLHYDSRVNLNTTYRTPITVTKILKRHYYPHIQTMNPKQGVITTKTIRHVNEIPRMYTQYLTFTQNEKQQLILSGYNNTKTAGEYQGSSNNSITIVRLSHSVSNPLYEDDSQIIVLLSRCKSRLNYYTVIKDKLYNTLRPNSVFRKQKKIESSIYIGNARNYVPRNIVKKIYTIGKTTKVDSYETHQRILNYCGTIVDRAYKHYVHTKTYKKINMFYQHRHVTVNEMNAILDLTDEKNINLDVQRHINTKVDVSQYKIMYGKYVQSLNTKQRKEQYMECKLKVCKPDIAFTTKSFVDNINKRNINPPVINKLFSENNLLTLAEKFYKIAIDDKKFKQLKMKVPINNIQDLKKWVSSRTLNQRKALVNADIYKGYKYYISLKQEPKPNLDNTDSKLKASNQVVAAGKPTQTAILAVFMQALRYIFIHALKPHLKFYEGLNKQDVENYLSHRLKNKSFKNYGIDFSKYDKSQQHAVFFIICAVFKKIGMTQKFIDEYIKFNTFCKFIVPQLGLKFSNIFTKKSGEYLTYFGNTLINMIMLTLLEDLNEENTIAAIFGGDDSTIFVKEDKDIRVEYAAYREIFNMDLKIESNKHYIYFASTFIIITKSGVYIVPDPLKKLKSLKKLVYNLEVLKEIHTSYRDAMQCIENSEITNIITHVTYLKYKQWYSRNKTFYVVLTDFLCTMLRWKNFITLYDTKTKLANRKTPQREIWRIRKEILIAKMYRQEYENVVEIQ